MNYSANGCAARLLEVWPIMPDWAFPSNAAPHIVRHDARDDDFFTRLLVNQLL